MEDCVFCRIVAGEIPGDVVYRDNDVVAFRDINPQAPVHVVVVPRKHIASLNQFLEFDRDLLGKMMLAGKLVAKTEKVSENGYRLVMNCGPDGGQVVSHAHLHVLGGRRLSDEMG